MIARVKCRFGPARHPLLLMLAEPRRLALRASDGLWLRIVDVPGALGARGYASDGSIVLEVSDEFLPVAAGRWRLTAGDRSGHLEVTTDPADLALDTTDLAAVYLGAFSYADLARAGRTHELTPGGWARADALFASSVAPWSSTAF